MTGVKGKRRGVMEREESMYEGWPWEKGGLGENERSFKLVHQ